MKAKLVINEIKQGKEDTGLGVIGIGKIATFDPLIKMMSDLDSQKFWLFCADVGEPASQEEFVIKFNTGPNTYSVKLEGNFTDGSEIWMKYDEPKREVYYKSTDGTIIYKNPQEFFKIYTNEQDISDSLEEEMKNSLINDGFKVFDNY